MEAQLNSDNPSSKLTNSNDSDNSHSESDISVSDLLEEDNDFVYQQFKEQLEIEKSIERYGSNTNFKPFFRENYILEKNYEEKVNNDDEEINSTENHDKCHVDVDIDADNFNDIVVNDDFIDIRPTFVEELCDNRYESNVLLNKEDIKHDKQILDSNSIRAKDTFV